MNNGFGSNHVLGYITCIVTTVFLCLINSVVTAKKNQEQYFSGVGSQNQNSRSGRAIQNIMYMERTFMVHCSLHRTDNGADDISLWSFAANHVVWLQNLLPNYCPVITLLEFITSNKNNNRDLSRSHVYDGP